MKSSWSRSLPLLLLTLFLELEGATPLAFMRPCTTKCTSSEDLHYDRRAFLSNHINAGLAASVFVLNPHISCADEEILSSPGVLSDGMINRDGKPFTPLQALLPATRLKLWVDEVYTLSTDLKSVQVANERCKVLQQINEILSNPPKLFRGEKMEKRTTSSTAQLTTGISTVNKDQYQQNRKGLNIGNKMNAMLNQADVERQWGMLQFAESKREEGNEMRAAFNFYTRQLSFGDEYVLTASKEDRKKMIRNDELPTLSAVITSDLDRRDLYRNQFLTAIDDAIAESQYQVKLSVEEVDVTDLVDLVKQSHSAIENWFALIAATDVDEAVREVQSNR